MFARRENVDENSDDIRPVRDSRLQGFIRLNASHRVSLTRGLLVFHETWEVQEYSSTVIDGRVVHDDTRTHPRNPHRWTNQHRRGRLMNYRLSREIWTK
jgi:hypothetical protein